MIDACNHIGDVLVQIGFARLVVFNATTRKGDVVWTAEGLVFRNQLLKAYDQIAKGKGKSGMAELANVTAFIIANR